jgi:nucleotide-binding universal stress UspA family protein
MLPKKILVATDGSGHADAALDTAIALAGKLSAGVGLFHVVDVRQLEGPFLTDLSGLVGVGPFLNFQKQVREILVRKGESILAAGADRCLRAGVPVSTELAEGVVGPEICRASRSHDLVCLGRHGEHASWSGIMMGSTVEAVVRGSSRPVLVTAGAAAPFDRILVAYDGSRPASAALSLAVEMAEGTKASDSRAGEPILDEARRFIETHGLEAACLNGVGDPVSAIVEAAADFDLLIMGAYGHSRLREFLLGGNTAGVLSGVRTPVLLYR